MPPLAPSTQRAGVDSNRPPSNQSPEIEEVVMIPGSKTDASCSFRSQHYEMDGVAIGTFQSQRQSNSKMMFNKFKVVFSKRRFVYEFLITNVLLADHDRTVPHVVVIDVPFETVNALHCNGQVVLISVTRPPTLYVNCRPIASKSNGPQIAGGCSSRHGDRSRPTDITGGQLRINHLHKIYLRKCSTDTLKSTLQNFDPRFTLIMQTPILEILEVDNSSRSCGGADGGSDENRGHQCVIDVIQPPRRTENAKFAQACYLCHCQVSCRSNRCSCMKARVMCGQGLSECVCKNCDNPLNVLDSLGFRAEECAADICLIHNIVTYKGDLRDYLERSLKFPCCGHTAQVKDCIPGTVRCPNVKCCTPSGGPFKFSWCAGKLQDEKKRPRNHCSLCRSCQGCIDLHCSACRRCNPLKTTGSKCPNCRGPRDTTYTEIRDIATVLLMLSRSQSMNRRRSPSKQTRATRTHAVKVPTTSSGAVMSTTSLMSPSTAESSPLPDIGVSDLIVDESSDDVRRMSTPNDDKPTQDKCAIGEFFLGAGTSLMDELEATTTNNNVNAVGGRQVDSVVSSSTRSPKTRQTGGNDESAEN